MLDDRLTDQRNPRSARIDVLSPLELVTVLNEEDRTVAEAVGRERESIARAVELVAETQRSGGRLFYVGAGTSGRLGVLDAAEMPPTFGTAPEQVQGIIAGGYEALVRAREGAEDRPEVITGSTRLKAGTATKLVLNTLTTGVMILTGKVRGPVGA